MILTYVSLLLSPSGRQQRNTLLPRSQWRICTLFLLNLVLQLLLVHKQTRDVRIQGIIEDLQLCDSIAHCFMLLVETVHPLNQILDVYSRDLLFRFELGFNSDPLLIRFVQ